MTNIASVFKNRDIALLTNVHIVKLWFFQLSSMDMSVGLQRKLSIKDMMLLNCGVGKDS